MSFNLKFEEMKSELKEAITQAKGVAASALGIADANFFFGDGWK